MLGQRAFVALLVGFPFGIGKIGLRKQVGLTTRLHQRCFKTAAALADGFFDSCGPACTEQQYSGGKQ